MTWFKVDDQLHSHPKVVELCATATGRTALGLWVRAGSYCGAHAKLEGRVSRRLAASWGFNKKHSTALVEVGLWHETSDGFEFHDWREFQPSPGKDAKSKEDAAKRSRDYRDRKRDGHGSVTRDGDHTTDHARARSPTRPDPTRPVQSERPPVPPDSLAPFGSPILPESEEESGDGDPPSLYAHLLTGYQRRRQDAGLFAASTGAKFGEHMTVVTKWVRANAEQAEQPALGDRMLDGFFAAGGETEAKEFRISWLAQDPGQYLTNSSKKTGRKSTTDAYLDAQEAREKAQDSGDWEAERAAMEATSEAPRR